MKPVTLLDDSRNFNAHVPDKIILFIANTSFHWKHTNRRTRAALVTRTGKMAQELHENGHVGASQMINKFATDMATKYHELYNSYAH